MVHRVRIIYNPTAGPWDMRRTLRRLMRYLERSGWASSMVETHHSGDAIRLAAEAAREGLEAVLVAGGDGTINEAVNGLAGSETALGIIPVGTGNILARQLRMPLLTISAPFYVAEVGDALLQSRLQRVDLGVANGRRFLCWAGLGLDAEITAQMEPRPRYIKHLRTIPYIIAAFSVASQFRGVRSHIRFNARYELHTRVLMVLASNIQLYAAYFKIARNAAMDDGLLDVIIFKGLGLRYALRHLPKLFFDRSFDNPHLIQRQVRHLVIETDEVASLQLDGDPYGEAPVEIAVRPAELLLLVPPSAPASLFTQPEVTR